jgi:hypothetical protein
MATNATESGEWETVELGTLDAEERERILRDLHGAENDCE